MVSHLGQSVPVTGLSIQEHPDLVFRGNLPIAIGQMDTIPAIDSFPSLGVSIEQIGLR
jgi:hypothetical protein